MAQRYAGTGRRYEAVYLGPGEPLAFAQGQPIPTGRVRFLVDNEVVELPYELIYAAGVG